MPWWRHAPRRVRAMLHQAVVGEPLPPNDLANLPPTCPRCPRLPRLRRPSLPRIPRLRRPTLPRLPNILNRP